MCSELLAELQPGVCSGLYANLLLRQAAVHREKQQYDAALQNLTSALDWEPGSAECLHSRAMVITTAGW